MTTYNLLVVSDMHLSEGFDPRSGKFSRLEDFLFDVPFDRFLRYHEGLKEQPRFGGRPWLLIINGDVFDFLQVVSRPDDDRLLRVVKGSDSPHLSENEKVYGLGTTAGESLWKLSRIARGHQTFFAALGWFVAQGNAIAVLKGNHDVELHWPVTQERFVREVRRAYERRRRETGDGPPLPPEVFRERIRFYPWFYYEPGRVYIEHGCQYEQANHFRDFLNPVLPDAPDYIELPWGSLFVRYLFNKIEDVHPFADNIKPITRYLSWAFREDPLKTIDVLISRGPIFIKAFWQVARKTMKSAGEPPVGHGAPPEKTHTSLPQSVADGIVALSRRRVEGFWRKQTQGMLRGLLALALAAGALIALVMAGLMLLYGNGWMALAYLAVAGGGLYLRRRLGKFSTDALEGGYLPQVAQELEHLFGDEHAVRYIVLGHDHTATMKRLQRGWYVNTGAWVPIYRQHGPVEGREELTFFRLAAGYEGPPELLRWDGSAGGPTRVVVLD